MPAGKDCINNPDNPLWDVPETEIDPDMIYETEWAIEKNKERAIVRENARRRRFECDEDD